MEGPSTPPRLRSPFNPQTPPRPRSPFSPQHRSTGSISPPQPGTRQDHSKPLFEGPDTTQIRAVNYLFDSSVITSSVNTLALDSSTRDSSGSSTSINLLRSTAMSSDSSASFNSRSIAAKSLYDKIEMGLASSKEYYTTKNPFRSHVAESIAIAVANNEQTDRKVPYLPLEIASIHFDHVPGEEPTNHKIRREVSPKIERSKLFLMSVPDEQDEIMKFLASTAGVQAVDKLIRRLAKDFDDDMEQLNAGHPENMWVRATSDTTLERHKLCRDPAQNVTWTLVTNRRNANQQRCEAHGIAIYTELDHNRLKLRLVSTWNEFLFPSPIDHGDTKYHAEMARRYLLRPRLEKPLKLILSTNDVILTATDQITHIMTTPLQKDLSFCLLYFEKALRAGAQLVALPELTAMRSTNTEAASSYADVKKMFGCAVDFSFDFFFWGNDVWTDPKHKGVGGQYATMKQRMDYLEQWMSQLPELVKLPGGREKKVSVVFVGSPAVIKAWTPQRHWDTYELLGVGEEDSVALGKRVREESNVVLDGERMELGG